MDFEFTNNEKNFRMELCDFLDREITKEIVEESDSGLGLGPHSWELMRKLGAKRWLAPSYPLEYGGLGLSRIYRSRRAKAAEYFWGDTNLHREIVAQQLGLDCLSGATRI